MPVEFKPINLTKPDDVLPLVQDRLLGTGRCKAAIEAVMAATAVRPGPPPDWHWSPEKFQTAAEAWAAECPEPQQDALLMTLREILAAQEAILGGLYCLVSKGALPGLSIVPNLKSLKGVG